MFRAEVCSFSGEVDLTVLPPALEHLALSRNDFKGGIDLSSLPASLRRLDLRNNYLTGEVALDCLPASLEQLLLYDNMFFGEVDLSALNVQKRIRIHLNLGANSFTRYIPQGELPFGVFYGIQRDLPS